MATLTLASHPAPWFPGKHLPDHGPQVTTMPTEQAQRVGPQPPSPRRRQERAYSPKPAGGCWRGFCGLSPGSGWPWPRPPTAPGYGARWGRTDGTRSSCGCPPIATQDRAHRTYEKQVAGSRPLLLSHHTCKVTALPDTGPVASKARVGLDVLGSPWPR